MRIYSILFTSLVVLSQAPSHAVDLNYEGLSSVEEPLAVHLGDTTLRLGGLFDAPVVYDLDSDGDTELEFFGNFQLDLETQLDNSWTVGAGYFGSYSTVPDDDQYEDNFALYVQGAWGALLAGNVSGQAFNLTRSGDGVGNVDLVFDQPIGQLGDDGVAYIGRYGPSIISAVSDDEGNFDLGWTYQRPLGNKDYRFSLFYRNTADETGSSLLDFDSQALVGMAELTYGSSVFDLTVGTEKIDSFATETNRNYLKAGFRRKTGVWSYSLQALYGEMEEETQQSLALGVSYDIARGLSLNLGLNFIDSEIDMNNEQTVITDTALGLFSLRYSY